MKRLISVLLALIMVLSLSVAAFAAGPQKLYCKAPEAWENCNIYYWSDSNSNMVQWPGIAMEKDEKGVWYAEVPTDATNVIFNNKVGETGEQSPDLKMPTDEKVQYHFSDGLWSKYGDDPIEEFLTVYASVPDDWTAVYLHAWAGTAAYKEWPGEPMSKGEDGYWSATIPAKYSGVLVTAGTEGPQTMDLSVADYQNVCLITVGEVNEENKHTASLSQWPVACDHSYTGNVTTNASCDKAGVKTYTCTMCSHTYTEPISATGHSYTEGVCVICGAKESDTTPVASDYYLAGHINGADYGIMADSANLGSYKFTDGKLTVTFEKESYVVVKNGDNTLYMTAAYCELTTATLISDGVEKMKVPGNVELTFTLTENSDGSLTLSYVAKDESESGKEDETDKKEDEEKENQEDTDSGDDTNTTTSDYYLVGFINEADYDGDEYKFVNGKLTVTFTAESYLFVKNGEGTTYMTDDWQGKETTSVILTESSALEKADKLFAPANVKLTFTVAENSDGTLTLSYTIVGNSSGETDTDDETDTGETDTPGTDLPKDNDDSVITLFAKVPASWTTVNAYTWDADNAPQNGQWPGTPMTKMGEWYKLVITDKVANVVFNDGAAQTKDLRVTPGRDVYIIVADDLSTTIVNEDGSVTYEDPDDYYNDFPLTNFRVVGNASWMGNWDPANEAGRMRQSATNEYKFQVKDVPAGSYEFKITENGTWDRCWGKKDGTNCTFNLAEKSDVIIIFKLDGDNYSITVNDYGRTDDVDIMGIVVLMTMAIAAAAVLLLNKKKFI